MQQGGSPAAQTFEEPIEINKADLPPLHKIVQEADTNGVANIPHAAEVPEPTAGPPISAVAEDSGLQTQSDVGNKPQLANKVGSGSVIKTEQPSIVAGGSASRPGSSTGERLQAAEPARPKSAAVDPTSTNEVSIRHPYPSMSFLTA